MTKSATGHYDAAYFEHQARYGMKQGRANLFKFLEHVRNGMRVLDFGCGGGFLLAAMRERFDDITCLGVEINETAIEVARTNGLDVRRSLEAFDSASIDLVVSNHALEHVEDPLGAVKEIQRVLKPGAIFVCVVPCDKPSYRYDDNDIDFHLYSWSAGNLGNLVRAGGFKVVLAKELVHKWPPKWHLIFENLGEPIFHASSRIFGAIDRRRSQVKVVGRTGEGG